MEEADVIFKPLKNCICFMTRTSVYSRPIEVYKEKLKDLGATLVNSVTKDCTHVVLMRLVNPSEDELKVEQEDIRSLYKKCDQLDAPPPAIVLPAWVLASEKDQLRAIEKGFTIVRPDPVLTTVTDAILYGKGKADNSAEKKAASKKRRVEKAAQPKPAAAFDFRTDMAMFNSTQAILQDRAVLQQQAAAPETIMEEEEEGEEGEGRRADQGGEAGPSGGDKENRTPRGAAKKAAAAKQPRTTSARKRKAAEALEEEAGAEGVEKGPSPIPIPQFVPVPSPWGQPTPPPTGAEKKRGRPVKKAAAEEEDEEATPTLVGAARGRKGAQAKEKAEPAKKEKEKKKGAGTPGDEVPSTQPGAKRPAKASVPTPWKDAPRPWDKEEVERERAQMRKKAMESLGQPGPTKGFLAATNLDSEAKEGVKAALSKLRGVRMCAEGKEAGTVTHLLVGDPSKRTLKLLLACVNGAYLCDPLWVTASVEQGRWLWERPFLLQGKFQEAAQRFRSLQEEKRALPLAGLNVHVAQPSNKIKADPRFICSKQHLTTLAGVLGAKVVARNKADVTVVPGDEANFAEGKAAAGKGSGPVVHAEWLCKCVENVEKVATRQYE